MARPQACVMEVPTKGSYELERPDDRNHERPPVFVLAGKRSAPSRWRRILRLILTVATAGLALVTIFALSARLWWAFDLFSHFRLQYVAIAAVLCFAALAIRAYPSAAVLAAVALVHGWAIKDLWLGGSAEVDSDAVWVRVASANVMNSNPVPEEVLGFVRASHADVMVLVDAQGKRWRGVLSAIGKNYPYRAPDSWQDGAPVILFSRYPIVGDSVIPSPEGRRPYLAADVALGKETLTIVGVHASSPSPKDFSETRKRNLQLDYLANILEGAEGPVVITGDFNTTPWSPSLRDLLAAAGLRNAANGHGYIGTWPTWFWPPQIPIDHILVRCRLAVANMDRSPSIGSDHYPIVADLLLIVGDLERKVRATRRWSGTCKPLPELPAPNSVARRAKDQPMDETLP